MSKNTNTTANNNDKGLTFTKVVFLLAQNPDNDRWEPMAYFPDIDWDMQGNKASYMRNGQHGPCCEAFALLDCRAPRRHELAAVARLQAELRTIGYVVTPLDPKAWLESKATRRVELDRNVYEATAITDSEALLAVGERNKSRAA